MSANRLLELELRRLPAVAGVGFHDEPDHLVVHVLINDAKLAHRLDVRRLVAKKVREHIEERPDQAFVIEFELLPTVRTARPSRVQIIAVTGDVHDGEVEVHLARAGLRSVGRSAGVSSSAVANATFAALNDLGTSLPFRLDRIHEGDAGASIVVLARAGNGEERRYGLAGGPSPLDAACRATLHALNRYLERDEAWQPLEVSKTDA